MCVGRKQIFQKKNSKNANIHLVSTCTKSIRFTLNATAFFALPSTFKKDQTTYTMFSETRKNCVLGLKKGLKYIFSASVNATQCWRSLLGHMLDVFADLSLPRGVRQILK